MERMLTSHEFWFSSTITRIAIQETSPSLIHTGPAHNRAQLMIPQELQTRRFHTCQDTDQATGRARTATTGTRTTPTVSRFSRSSPTFSGTATGTPKASTYLSKSWSQTWRLLGHNLRSGKITKTTAAAAEPRPSPEYIDLFRKLSALEPWILAS